MQYDILKQLGLAPDHFLDRSILITGAARGIGAMLGRMLASLGAKVVLVDINPSGAEVAADIEARGGWARFLACDLGIDADLEQALRQVEAWIGQPDYVINNAMQAQIKPLIAHDIQEWDRIFSVNTRAAFAILRWCLPVMLQRGHGTLVNILSAEGTPMTGIYAASKSALRSLTLSAAREIDANCGVHVIGFAPAVTATESVLDIVVPTIAKMRGISPEAARKVIAQNPGYDDLMPVEHCAAALVFVLAHGNAYHGQIADPFGPLDRFGIIHLDHPGNLLDATIGTMPDIPENVRSYLHDITEVNRALEQRVNARTNELVVTNRLLADLAVRDSLTGIHNRRFFDEQLEACWNIAQRTREPLSLFMIDIDHFKRYNDDHGHQAGDDCLRQVAAALNAAFARKSDVVARYGGEEFVAMTFGMDNALSASKAEELCARIRALKNDKVLSPVTISVGYLSAVPEAADVAAAALRAADAALYQAKQQGRNRALQAVWPVPEAG